MKRQNKTMQVLSFLLSASLTLQVVPSRAWADNGSGQPGPGDSGTGQFQFGPGSGHGHHGSPSPSPSAAPVPPPVVPPAPTPTQSQVTPPPVVVTPPSQGPAPVNTDGAHQQGELDCLSDGQREGNERGPKEGRESGMHEGFEEGRNRCAKEMADHAHDAGFQQGYGEGSVAGQDDAQANGTRDGSAAGQNDGQAAGRQAADQQANTDATPLGRQKGLEQADASDAAARGQADGVVQGDQQALSQAQSVDYPAGRKAYHDAEFAASPESTDVIVQKAGQQTAQAGSPSLVKVAIAKLQHLADAVMGHDDHGDGHDQQVGANATPDFRYFTLKHSYPDQAENDAYSSGARDGYTQGFQSSYIVAFNSSYQSAHEEGERRGCEEAHHADYSQFFVQGEGEGKDRGYHETYNRLYPGIEQAAHDAAFGPARDAEYKSDYRPDYDHYFELARAQAYNDETSSLYNNALAQAKQATYNAKYPAYQHQQFKKGQEDEAADFASRPLRITAVEASETIVNGVFEPGEPLRVHLSLRSFSKSGLHANDVTFQLVAQDGSKSTVTIPNETLVKDLKAESLTEIREALEFQMNESALGSPQSFTLSVYWRGKQMDTQTFAVNTQYLLGTQMPTRPSFKEGIAMPIDVLVTNNSSVEMDSAVASINVDSNVLEIDQPTVNVGPLAPGQSKTIEFMAVGQNITSGQQIAMGISLNDGSASGRRIGELDINDMFDVINDYKIELTDSADALRNAGLVRLTYSLRNVGHRMMYHSLQVKASFLNIDGSNFVVIGPNPQFLFPMDQDEAVNFVIPVMVKAANGGGILKLEVQEAGKTVIIHKVDFTPKQNLN